MSEVRRHAVISDDGLYRYVLGRSWGPDWFHGGSLVTWVMLNPSVADAEIDDQTVKQCVTFSQREGFDQLAIVNLFAYRATKPGDLRKAVDPIGPENLTYVKHYLGMADKVIVGWGVNRWPLKEHEVPTYAAVRDHQHELWSLGATRSGQPCHPCRLCHELPLVPWPS